ncbi:uncharacterized protein NECHADRAFT_83214 [Fusarium vanettenii 77-13-4]|uniref:Uncharacterized protein n=1 Tax=Fusarium vanettenii (strain ATCC MYA-4622 / CBS 123669 / FGSC 9596 / NRRL 45880 / 77-13-4) TaxID=660122 RepID=C7ZB57_FUSV7|nr:uncharacterized protein NECHADRAFT_83214 [Fusarium vanettenii 77-13-4]EEU38877.1 hypothetical protein NECHADRAFT_83214 [Fusarium vanettenii 77-13-4]
MSTEPSIIDLLYDMLDQQPGNVYILERIIEAWESKNEKDPDNAVALLCLQAGRDAIRAASSSSSSNGVQRRKQAQPRKTSTTASTGRNSDLLGDYKQLMLEAEYLKHELSGIMQLSGLQSVEECQEAMTNLGHISRGEISKAIHSLQPVSVRESARNIAANRDKAQELLVQDFEAVIAWASQETSASLESIRDRLVKRKTLLDAALPENMARYIADALALVERKHLKKKYVNSETMLGDKVEEIPAENFFVSEDNYVWDMDELAQALAVNDGVMRNPLSKEMFTEADIRNILSHRLGVRLKPIQLAQSQLKQGVRAETIRRVETLGSILLADQTENAAPSRSATDEFLAYMATLPESEQNTINSLKIPARDKLNGQPYDYTIGQYAAR